MSFYCKIGDIETTTPWHRPTLTTLQSWYQEWSQVEGVDKYEVYSVGNFAEMTWGESHIPTWDCDIVLTGDITDYDELKTVMQEAVRIGFKHKILIDIWYNDELLNFESFRPLKQIRAFKTFYKEVNGEIYEHTFKGVRELVEGLYQMNITQPTKSCKKAYDRHREGTYQGVQKLITDI